MKIYEHNPQKLVRVQISQQGDKAQYLTFSETNKEEVVEVLKNLITAQKINPFAGGRVTSLAIRDAIGAKNGKSISISFKGMNPKQVYDLIIKHFSK